MRQVWGATYVIGDTAKWGNAHPEWGNARYGWEKAIVLETVVISNIGNLGMFYQLLEGNTKVAHVDQTLKTKRFDLPLVVKVDVDWLIGVSYNVRFVGLLITTGPVQHQFVHHV